MKSRLFNLSDKVTLGGKEYKINTDFKVWIEIEGLLFAKEPNPAVRLAKILTLAYPVLPPNPYDAVRGITHFYMGESNAETKNGACDYERCYDLTEDFDYIWGGFLTEYGIDLTKVDMHWWKFKTLLRCLSEDCKFSKIVAYRTVDTSRIKDKELRRFYERMKKQYKLRSGRRHPFDEDAVADSLAGLF